MNQRDSFRCVEVSKPCIPMGKAANFLVSLLLERSDAQIIVSRFPCGDTTLLHNLRCQPRPLFIICGEAATTTL